MQWAIATSVALCSSGLFFGGTVPFQSPIAFGEDEWQVTRTVSAPEAHQAAAADEQHLYAITNHQVAKYDRESGQRLAVSEGDAQHLNSGFLWQGRLLCAHSNYPRVPERSEIKSLDLKTMRLTTFKDFGNHGGSLTWVVRYEKHWWCNFAYYGAKNGRTYLAKFDEDWNEVSRWTYPEEVISKLGRYSLSGGIWDGNSLLVTGHDDPVAFRLRLPQDGNVLTFIERVAVPFTGQGFAHDPRTGGLVGINRANRQIVIAAPTANLICCGADEVFIIDPADPGRKIWSWRAKDSASIPESFRAKFRSTDECKPYAGDLLLVTSSSGGVALIQRATKKCLFLAESRNAHSACLLPQDQIAVASSYGGDKVEFYDRQAADKPAAAQQSIPLKGAHGTVWDAKRKCLWALGGDELLRLVANGRAAIDQRWSVAARHRLPTPGGHDLSPAGDGVRLLVTSNTQVLLFDRDEPSFQVHKQFGDAAKVKSITVHPRTKKIVYHQASKEHWWSDTIRFDQRDPIRLQGERLYKVRWDQPEELP